MTINFKRVAEKIYDALQASGYEEIQTFDVDGNRIYGVEIKDANDNSIIAKKFYIPDDKIMVSINERGEEDSEVNVKLGPKVNIKEFSRVLGDKLRTIAYREGGLSYNVRSWGKELEPKDFAHSLKMREVKDMKVEEGKVNWTGTTRSSYSRIGECRIIVRHNDRVNEDKFGSRTRNIESVFVETPSGERFRIPENNIHGARALARHITNGGMMNDSIGNRIVEMIEKMAKLRDIYNEARKASKDEMISEQANELAFNIRENYIRVRESLRKMSGKIGYVRETESFDDIVESKEEKVEKKLEKDDAKKPNTEFDRPLSGKDRFKRDAENLFSVNESRKVLPEITLLENELTKLSEVEFFTETDFLDEEVITEKTNPENALHNLNMYVGHPLFKHYLSIYENQGIVDDVLSLVEVDTKLWNAILENRENISEFQMSTMNDMNGALQKLEMLMNQNNISVEEAVRQVAEEMAPMMGGTETVESLEQQIYAAAEENGLINHDAGSTFADDVLASDDTIEAHKAEINSEEYFGDSKFAESEEMDESLETEQISRIRQLAGIKKVSEEELNEYSSKMKYEVSDEEFDNVANSPETRDEFKKLSNEMDKALSLKAKEIHKASGGDEELEEKMWKELGDEAGVVSSILQNYGFSKNIADEHGRAYVRSLKDGNSGWVFDNAAVLKILNRIEEAVSEDDPGYDEEYDDILRKDFTYADGNEVVDSADFPDGDDFDPNEIEDLDYMFEKVAQEATYQVEAAVKNGEITREMMNNPAEFEKRLMQIATNVYNNREYDVLNLEQIYDHVQYLANDILNDVSEGDENITRLQQLAGIKEYNTWGSPKVADPHGGAMISPYGNELGDSEVDNMYDNVKSMVDDELKIYSDVLASKEVFLQHYDMEDVDSLASEIASDAMAKASRMYSEYGEEDLYYDYVDHNDIQEYVKSKFMAALGEAKIEEGDPFNRHKKDLRDRDRTLIRPEDKLNAGGKFSFEEGFRNSYVDSSEIGVNPEHVYTRWHDLKFAADKNDPRWVEKLRQKVADEYGITPELVKRITHGDINSRMMGIEEAAPLYHGDGGDKMGDMASFYTQEPSLEKERLINDIMRRYNISYDEAEHILYTTDSNYPLVGGMGVGKNMSRIKEAAPLYHGDGYPDEETIRNRIKVKKREKELSDAGDNIVDLEKKRPVDIRKKKPIDANEAKERADWTYGREETMMKRLDRDKYGQRGADKQGSAKKEPEDKYSQMAKKYSSKMKKEDINSELSEEARRIIQLARHK